MIKKVNRTITLKQRKILEYINAFANNKGYAPSLKEVANKFGLSSISTVHHHIKALNRKGYLKKEVNHPRGISVPESTPETLEIPLLGYITAGNPIEPIENPVQIKVPRSMVYKRGNFYALKVKGDSMMEDGILDNDIVVIKHQQTAEDKDTVVAITENGATLKKFRKINGTIFLEPRNKNYKNITPKELEIRGKFVGLLRGI